MIPFFRKLRKKLADDNKPLKYLRYAIGEIVLVVIGILIALQINNWNEERKNYFKLTTILNIILEDIKEDAINLKTAIDDLTETNKKTKLFLLQQDFNGFTRDSLENRLETFNVNIDYQTNGFEYLRNSGITDYGTYGEVIKSIIWYYDNKLVNLKIRENSYNQAVTNGDNFWRYNQNSYEFNYDKDLNSYQSGEAAKKELITLLKSPVPRNILKIDYRNKKKLITDFEQLIKYLNNKIIPDLENALK
jgi:hypothetical protein